MFLRRLEASDSRFKTIEFRDGLNLIVAHRGEESTPGASRNGTGKTSLALLLRYVLGGSLPKQFNLPALKEWSFSLYLGLPGIGGVEEAVRVTRPVSPQTQVEVEGWSKIGSSAQVVRITEWRELLGRELFAIPNDMAAGLTAGSLWARLIRTSFGSPTKGYPTDADWETGLRIGYLLGLDPHNLARSGDAARLERQRRALTAAVKEGALSHLELDEGKLRAELSSLRRRRDTRATQLAGFRIDDNYEERQRRANELTVAIRDLNDEQVTLERRASEIREALASEPDAMSESDEDRISRMYGELGLVFSDGVARRYDEVRDFYASVVRNRRRYLERDLASLDSHLNAIRVDRRLLDAERAQELEFLRESVAFDTFLSAQRQLGLDEAAVAEAERQLASAAEVNSMGARVDAVEAEAAELVRRELQENQEFLLAKPLAEFNSLGAEIYDDRVANLLVSEGRNGILKVVPEISGDASDGIRGVETFLLDIVCLTTAMEIGRAPRVLVHDSHLYDAVDHRQVASCLNIGARLAESRGFQYVVTLNSDFLSSVEDESQGAFDSVPYQLPVLLTDEGDDGGLFGFRFD